MKVAAIALLAVLVAPAWAQHRMALSQEQQEGVNYMLTTAPGTTKAEAEMFLHVGQAKLAACEVDVRSTYCRSLAAMLDDLRPGIAKRAMAAGTDQTPRPQARQ